MSQQEVHIGKLKKVDRFERMVFDSTGTEFIGRLKISVEEWCENYCKENDISHVKYFCDSWEETLMFACEDKFIIVDNEIYEIIEDKSFDGYDIFEATENKDGTINYCLSFCNGGCGFNEALEEAIENMNK